MLLVYYESLDVYHEEGEGKSVSVTAGRVKYGVHKRINYSVIYVV